jgi:hypothetical protein
MMKTPQTTSDLQNHLAEQIAFLESSCAAFDNGQEVEAKRIAVQLRILFHDTKNSKSLLGQLNMLNGTFVDTSTKPIAGSVVAHNSLAYVEVGAAVRYIPMLERVAVKNVTFMDWWNGVIFVDNNNDELTRAKLVLTIANQDGGAHVDPALDKVYADLSRNNSLGLTKHSPAGEEPMPGPERAALRQIAYEALKSIKPGYAPKSPPPKGTAWGGMYVGQSAPPDIAAIHFQGPGGTKTPDDDLCPCGSGQPYKGCHNKT